MARSLAAYLGLLSLIATAVAQSPYTGFIRVSNGRFVDAACKEYLFSGWNGWEIMEAAANKISIPGYANGREYLRDKFARAQRSSLNIMRFFTVGDDHYKIRLLEGPGAGQFNQEALEALDFILDEAAKAGIKLVVVPINMWMRNNGVQQWEEWCGSAGVNSNGGGDNNEAPYDWYISPQCRQMFKDYLAALVNRVNSINGVRYRDDPVIFAWNLINEPRCSGCDPAAINDWIADTSAFLKSIDPNHMVTTGAEGFFAGSDPFEVYNPPGNWADQTGQDFRANHASPNIDYAVIHMWPDNWMATDLTFGFNWINSHIEAARALGKPLVLEEFGKNAGEGEILKIRDPWFQLVHDLVEENLSNGGPLRGSLFWEWDLDGSGPRDGTASTIRDNDSTFKDEITPFSQRLASEAERMHRGEAGTIPGCTPAALPSREPQAPAGANTTAASSATTSDTGSSNFEAPEGGPGAAIAGRRLQWW